MDIFEKNIVNNLNDITQEDMNSLLENIDPAEFKCSPTLKSEIEDIVMSNINSEKKTKNKKIIVIKSLAACAAVAIIGTGVLAATNSNVKASLEKLFTFAPNKGVVEVEPTDTVLELTNTDTQVSTGSLDLSIISAYTLDDQLTVEYEAVLKGTYTGEIEGLLDCNSFSEQLDLTKNYLIEKGYDKYFNFPEESVKLEEDLYTDPISSVIINGTEYKGEFVSISYASENMIDFSMSIIQTYPVPRDVYQNMDEINFSLGDINTTFTLEEKELEETSVEALDNGYIVEANGIKIRLVPTWTKNELILDGYVLDSGDYDVITGFESIDRVLDWTNENGVEVNSREYLEELEGHKIDFDSDGWNVSPDETVMKYAHEDDYAFASLYVGDQRINAEIKESDSPNKAEGAISNRYHFNLEGVDLSSGDITLRLLGVDAIKTLEQPIVLNVDDNEDIEYDVPYAHLSNFIVENYPEDNWTYVECKIDNYDNDVAFSDVFTPECVDGKVTIDKAWYTIRYEVKIPLTIE